MSIVSYAQNFEDVLLWRALHDVEGGRYLDIGAQDPVIDSVSLAFYQAGWRGVHVEATPEYVELLRNARPDETVIEAAVTDAEGLIPFFAIEGTGLSTGVPSIADRHRNQGYQSAAIQVPTIRLDHLLEMMGGEVHWMKIDAEGMEADVLRSWGPNSHRPWFLVIESTFPNTQEPAEQLWIEEVVSRGYQQVFFDGLSRYFVHEAHAELAPRFAAPANVFDGFAITSSHFAAREIAGSFMAELENAQVSAAQNSARLHADLEQSLITTAALSEERDCARAALELAEAARHAATTERDLAREKETAALAQLVATEQERCEAYEALWRERQIAEEELRRAARELEESLRNELRQAQTAAVEARIKLARLEERSGQQLELIRRSDEAAKEVSERHAEAQQQAGERYAEAQRQAGELRALLEQCRSTIAKADTLIGGVLSERAGRWQHIGLALGLARRSPTHQALSEWIACEHEATSAPATLHPNTVGDTGPAMLARPATEQRNPYLRADSLPELLSWHDVDFVRCAYVTVLGRQPDTKGEVFYTDRLRRGHSKMEVLWQLRRSPEGLEHDPGIAGFDRALKMARWQRRPFLGWAVRSLTGGEGNGSGWKRHRALINRVALVQIEQAQQTHWLGSIDAKLDQLSAKQGPPTGAAPPTSDSAIRQEEQPAAAPMRPMETDPELDSRARYAMQLLQLEAKTS